jgi:sugar phosphate isomerase/epimerase
VRLGVSTSVFGRSFTPPLIDALDATGVSVVEVVGPVPGCAFDQPSIRQALRERLRDSDVRVRSVHLPYGRNLDLSQPDARLRAAAVAATEANLRAAAALGASLAVVHPSAEPIDEAIRPAHLDAARHSLEALAIAASEIGVPLAVECLPRTCLGNTAAELATLVSDLEPSSVGVCIDVNHLNLREADLTVAVGVLGERLLTLHCSDNDGVDERHWLPGDARGVVDWDAFFRGLAQVGYRGPFLYELRPFDLSITDTLNCIAENFGTFVAPAWRATASSGRNGSAAGEAYAAAAQK